MGKEINGEPIHTLLFEDNQVFIMQECDDESYFFGNWQKNMIKEAKTDLKNVIHMGYPNNSKYLALR